VIGTLLGLPREELKIIELENHKAVPCCNAMLEKWLDVDIAASWNKLLSVLHSPAVSSGPNPKTGNSLIQFKQKQSPVYLRYSCAGTQYVYFQFYLPCSFAH